MKRILIFFSVAFLSCVAFAQQKKQNLQQIVTTKLTTDIKPYYPKDYFSLFSNNVVNAVIVKSDDIKRDYLAIHIRDFLKKKWNIEIPIVNWKEAKNSKKDLVLFGTVNENTPLR